MFKLVMIDPIETDVTVQDEIREIRFLANVVKVLDALDEWSMEWDGRMSFTCHLIGSKESVDFTDEIQTAWHNRIESGESDASPSFGKAYTNYVNTMGGQI